MDKIRVRIEMKFDKDGLDFCMIKYDKIFLIKKSQLYKKSDNLLLLGVFFFCNIR